MGGALAVVAAACAVLALSCTAGQQTTDTSASDPVARGRYLTTVAGCNDCHTPGGLYGAPDSTRLLSGSEVGWTGFWGTTFARNLTPDSTGLAAWSEEDIVRALRQGQRPDGSPILPPMPWPAYANLTDEDARAIAAFLKSIPAVNHPVPDRLPPGTPAPTALVFPPPPAWDGQNLPPPPTAPADTSAAP
jgi:mono/diheme cytochrome c family protein